MGIVAFCAGALAALVSSGCSARSIQQRQGTEQLRYVEWQVRGSARVLGWQFKDLGEMLPPNLADDADLVAQGWHAFAIGDIDEPPCDQMRAAYEALGNWLLLQSDRMFTDASDPLEMKLNRTHVEAVAMKWQFNDECKGFLLGRATPQ